MFSLFKMDKQIFIKYLLTTLVWPLQNIICGPYIAVDGANVLVGDIQRMMAMPYYKKKGILHNNAH